VKRSLIVLSLPRNLSVECEYRAEDQQVLCGRQTDGVRGDPSTAEKAAAWAGGSVVAVFDADDSRELAIWQAVLDRARHRFDGLCEARPAAIAIPRDLRTHGQAPMLVDRPMGWQLSCHPRRTRLRRCGNSLRRALILEGDSERIPLPLCNAVREEAPELKRRFGLVRTEKEGLLKRPMSGWLVGDLTAEARHRICVGSVPVSVDQKSRHGELLADRVASIHAKHK